MRLQNTPKRIINPNIRIVWIAAIGSELKVANPDNVGFSSSSLPAFSSVSLFCQLLPSKTVNNYL